MSHVTESRFKRHTQYKNIGAIQGLYISSAGVLFYDITRVGTQFYNIPGSILHDNDDTVSI